MKKLSTLAVLAAAVVSTFAVVGSAQGATWHAAPAGGVFTAASGGTSALKVQSHPSTTCTTPTASGRVTGAGGGIVNGPVFTAAWNTVATVTPVFAGCTNAGINYTVRCGAANFNATANGYNSGVTTTQLGSADRFTGGSLSGILCTIKPTATPSNNCTTVTGTVPATYLNPSNLAAGVGADNQGSLSIGIAGQSLTAASVGGCINSIGTGSATFGVITYSVAGSPAASVAAPDLWAS
jgi:hypothetical protein